MRWILGTFLGAALLTWAFPLPVTAQQETAIRGSLSNFDVHQGCFDEADNFELDILGDIDPDDFTGFFPGWGSPPRFDDIKIGGVDLGAEVLWLDRSQPIPYCEWRHFGVQVDPALPPMSVQAYWTRVIKDRQIPVPFQWWVVQDEGLIIDRIVFSPTFDEGPVWIRREWAVNPDPIPLEELQFDTLPLQWMPGDEFLLAPGDMMDLPIPRPPDMAAVLVRYTVTRENGDTDVRFVTEAVLVPFQPEIVSVLVNFDLHNNIPGTSFDNLELDFFGDWLDPGMVRWWYDLEIPGPPPPFSAWGVDPLFRRFPPGMFPGLPGGLEVTWLDKYDTFDFCETYHFGLEFGPEVMLDPNTLPSVQAYWTRIDTCQVPVPWQFWQPVPGGPIFDIILLSETYWPGQVEVSRDYVALENEFPLEDLTWDNLGGLPWTPVAGDPQILSPGEETILEIPFSDVPGPEWIDPLDRAALVRYTVRPVGGDVETRFMNEALITPPTSQVPDEEVREHGTRIEPNLPNPFADWTLLIYRVEEECEVFFSIYDVNGREVAFLDAGVQSAGIHSIRFDARNEQGQPLPAGIYFAVMDAGGEVDQRKIVVRE
ncbi:MAG: T9SS type A sorting domain-containing protein [Candidatus Eisenbacteria bacterium]|uniref:T9SS type A sorting domain-containing protein n=1 Tax=Eiseniibacteriota bacterium TaxID=2212470 RepID=A0A956NH44_UNCEI|nr:T9SS type A sorting domain-containing protein [Candidatus Eisenbacteria bacterium]